MQRSDDRILTTHAGSLPACAIDHDRATCVRHIVRDQRDTGLDIVNEGEFTKGGDWLSFADDRLGGFEPRPTPSGTPLIQQGKDREVFADFYRYAAERGTLFYTPGEQIKTRRQYSVCTSPITYTGGQALSEQIRLLRDAAGSDGETFLTSTAPGSLEVYRGNAFYDTDEEFLFAIADALAVEYRTIAAAGVILQVDDAWLPALWDRIGIPMGLDAFRKRCELRVEALNHALAGIPEEQVRYHMCWGSWHGPHAYDLELVHLIDILLALKAGAYVIEGANARHEHEHAIWEQTRLPPGKILVPGVVTHSTDVVEHPELVSQRIQRFAARVGRENVIAGADCGFGGRSHPQIAWAKLGVLVEGARLASRVLFS